MSVELINGHVIFPHQPNWAAMPDWSRRWQNEISEAVTGAESRFALRVAPRSSLSFVVTPGSNVEQSMLEDRILAAMKSGKACAPYWGRASVLNADCNSAAVVLQNNFWNWKVGEHVFFSSITPGSLAFDVRTITAAAGNNLTLNLAPTAAHLAGALIWPLIFGKPVIDDMPIITGQRGSARIKIQELVGRSVATVGALVPPAGAGIGSMAIGTTFEIA